LPEPPTREAQEPDETDPPQPDGSVTDGAAPPTASGEGAASAEEGGPETSAAAVLGPPQGQRWYQALVIPALAVVTALVIGALIIVFSNDEALAAWGNVFEAPLQALTVSWQVIRESYLALLTGAFGSPTEIARAVGSGEWSEIQDALYPLSETIVTATPLIFVGLSVALGFRAGLFNIGAEGQVNVGALFAAAAGISFTWLPAPIHLVVMILAGFIGGAFWGFIPGILKAKTGAHEVITTIMLNFVAVSFVLYFLSTDFFKQQAEPVSKPVQAAYPHLLGSNLRLHLGIVVALTVAVAVGWLLNRTTVGFEFRAVGMNPHAARAAGMSPTRTTVVVMSLSGGLAGLAGGNQLASITPSLFPGFASGLGFDGIAIALLGRGSPLGVVIAAFLFGALRTGGRSMQVVTQTPIDIIVIIQALVIAFVAAPALVRAMYRLRTRRPTGASDMFAKGWGG
jgi:simple sugar transport system permease protein